MARTRRAMLLALGADISSIPAEELESEAPLTFVIGGDLGALGLEVVRFDMRSEVSMLDITSFGDTQSVYAQGVRTSRFSLDCIPAGKFEPMELMGRTIELDQEMAGNRVRCRMTVHHIAARSGSGPFQHGIMYHIEGTAEGKVVVEKAGPKPKTPAEEKIAGRRGMRL